MKNNLVSTLERFKKHPAYGSSKSSLDLNKIALFIDGYETALLVHGIDEIGSTFNGEFTNFIRKKYNLHTKKGWVEVLHRVSKDAEDELPLFFSLLGEFSKT